MRIEKLITKSEQEIVLGKISVLVGANNSGKSQTLKDIKEYLEKGNSSSSVIIPKIVFHPPVSPEEIIDGLEISNSPHNIGNLLIKGIKNNLLEHDAFELGKNSVAENYNAHHSYEFTLGNLSRFRVAHLDSTTRLNLVKTCASFNPIENSPSNLLQSLYVKKENEVLLQKAFKDAFDMDIKLDYSELIQFCLRVAKNLPLIPDDPQKALSITKELKKLDDQGDGFKSFVGIILGILFSKNRIILLDEPEAFLHPAQARFVGKWIVDNSEKLVGQLIIATHNSNFLNGVLSSDREVDVYRLNRKDDQTTYHLIPPKANKDLSKSPLLSSQRVLEAIFHKGVVVCEADADRAIYHGVSVIELNQQEILFVHSHNKQTLKDVARLLMAASIPVSVISDIDILNDEVDFSNLIAVLTKSPIDNKLVELRKEIAMSVNQQTDADVLGNLREMISEFLQQLEKNEHSLDGAKGAINRIQRGISKWQQAKEQGVVGFPSEVRDKVQEIINLVKQFRFFIVPVGELESWIDLGIRRKNKWIIPALEKVYNKQCPEPLKNFINEIVESLK